MVIQLLLKLKINYVKNIHNLEKQKIYFFQMVLKLTKFNLLAHPFAVKPSVVFLVEHSKIKIKIINENKIGSEGQFF